MTYEIDMGLLNNPNATNFGTQLLRLIMKADLHNLCLLKKGFPNAVKTVEIYRERGEVIDLPYD